MKPAKTCLLLWLLAAAAALLALPALAQNVYG